MEAGERLNSRLEWQGAEFLVLGHLLIEGIESYKPYVNHPAYDIVALNSYTNKIARISVKSRWATNRAGYFTLNSLDCDFVVHVALNRGERLHKITAHSESQRARLYILPIGLCASTRSASNKMNLNKIERLEQFDSHWDQIKQFLKA